MSFTTAIASIVILALAAGAWGIWLTRKKQH